jgi:putative NIF3 family GTP cyclohydrolase 1 type 2
MTARDIVTRIQKKLADQSIAWRAQTVDTFKAGSPDTDVRGIATTGMATFDLLRRAAARGRNFVITHEPTFYSHLDQTASLETDPIYQAKQRFIAEHRMIVFRFHDHAHMLQPDPLVAGSARALGWTKFASPAEPRIYVVPTTTLGALAAEVGRRLNGRAIRVVGDAAMKVSRIMLGPGSGVPALNASFDVAVGGETAEAGGNAEYAIDATEVGQPRGMILLGHMLSEDFGMQEVGDWLKTFLTDVPIEWIPAGEPFSELK